MGSHRAHVESFCKLECYISLERCDQSHSSSQTFEELPMCNTAQTLSRSITKPTELESFTQPESNENNCYIDDDPASQEDIFSWFDVIKAECADDESIIGIDSSDIVVLESSNADLELFDADADSDVVVLDDKRTHSPKCVKYLAQQNCTKNSNAHRMGETLEKFQKNAIDCNEVVPQLITNNISPHHGITANGLPSQYFCSNCHVYLSNTGYQQLHREQFHKRSVKVLVHDIKTSGSHKINENTLTHKVLTKN